MPQPDLAQPSPAQSPDAAPAVSAGSLPRVLGTYRLMRLLGSGATGRVFYGERIDFTQRVAIKCFHSNFVASGVGADPTRERELLTGLDHPNIVRLIDHQTAPDGTDYLVMEYVEGLPLDAHADAQRLTLNARLHLLLPVLKAVEYAHRHLVVHGDLKPANVLVGPDGAPRLLDFGSAALVGAEAGSLTLAYASPEQKLGSPVTLASDVFSLGLMARELLAGIAPTDDPAASIRSAFHDAPHAQTVAQARSTTVPRLVGALCGNLEAILHRALATEPERRYPSVAAMREDFERHLASLPIAARPVGRAESARLWVARHKLAAAMATLLLLVVAGSAAGVTWKAAEAAHQRRVAETRLEDLVQLNGSLGGELYQSVASLPGSQAARQSLLAGATGTLDSVRAGGVDVDDPRLALELAAQFEQVARLQLAQGNANDARTNATKGLAVLRDAKPSPATRAQMERLRQLVGR